MSIADVVPPRSAASLLLPARTTAAAMPMPMPNVNLSHALPLLAAKSTTTTITSVEIPHPSDFSTTFPTGNKRLRNGDHKEGRKPKLRQTAFEKTMEPPVLSFYGEQPVPLPSRFGQLKRRLVAGHEPALEASWARLLAALRDEIAHIESRGTDLIPSIDFGDVGRPDRVAPFSESVRRYGIGVVRGVVPEADAQAWVDETKRYLDAKHELKPPAAQDPTCFDLFWSPCQMRARAHPNVLHVQKFVMSLWDTSDDDRLATRFPISYADRIRIDTKTTSDSSLGETAAAVPPPQEALPAAAASRLIAQVDNGSLERWEADGYGHAGTYDSIWKGDWESYNPWDTTGRVNATTDLYNGAGACSMFRMFQGILALSTVEPGMVRLLPSPKLSTAYFLLRPFFAPRTGPPEGRENAADAAAWDAYLDASNWRLEAQPSTIIHGAVPGHAQRVTELWHPHLRLAHSLVAPPTLRPGDYIVWHPDQAYAFEEPRPGAPPSTSMLVYTPAAPLTQTNALFLARQRKAFQRGHPGPDFDTTGNGLGSEAPHTGRLDHRDIEAVGGEAGLQAMGLAPWNVAKTPPKTASPLPLLASAAAAAAVSATGRGEEKEEEQDSKEAVLDGRADSSSPTTAASTPVSAAEAEVVRLANIILFPDRYDFWMPSRMPSRAGTPRLDSSGSIGSGVTKTKVKDSMTTMTTTDRPIKVEEES